MTTSEWIRDTGEKLAATIVQHAIVVATIVLGPGNGDGKDVVIGTAVAALLTLLVNQLAVLRPAVTSYAQDLAFRILRTFLATAGSLVALDKRHVFDAASWKAAAIAGGVAVLVVIKAELAKGRPDTITPASLAPR